jgi:hypothetical protein
MKKTGSKKSRDTVPLNNEQSIHTLPIFLTISISSSFLSSLVLVSQPTKTISIQTAEVKRTICCDLTIVKSNRLFNSSVASGNGNKN